MKKHPNLYFTFDVTNEHCQRFLRKGHENEILWQIEFSDEKISVTDALVQKNNNNEVSIHISTRAVECKITQQDLSYHLQFYLR